MKDHSVPEDIKNIQESNTVPKSNSNISNINNFPNSFNSLQSSYTELKQSKIIELNIINSKTSIIESPQPLKYLTQADISLINELKEKYKNSPKITFENIDNILNIIKVNFSNDINSLDFDEYNMPIFPKELNTNNKCLFPIFDFPLSSTKNNLPFFNKNSRNLLFPFINNNSMLNTNLFLNRKRKKNDDMKKRCKKNLVFISNRKNKIKNINETDIKYEYDKENKNKKIIFRLSKGEKNKNKLRPQKDFNTIKIKKQPGRKKKNSGEVGTHNKFSKDNMMRKLKNKVMESARKLINTMIKKEAGNELKFFKEIRKIEGIYSQELNIKFNFWFYFQELKNIFQFNMSQKYSKGDLDSNIRLIQKIYSIEKRQKFIKTRKLLDMKFHEYYHNIFLGENPNWLLYYEIKDNKYQLDYFFNKNISDKDKEHDTEFYVYKKTLYNLACKYELFFLKKNPRLTGNKKKEEKESHSKQIIKDITNEQYEQYRYLFIKTGSFYNSEIANIYQNYLNDNKNKLFFFTPYQFYSNSNIYLNNNNINLNLQNKNKIDNNSTTPEKNQKKNDKINNVQKNNDKHNHFDVSKKLLFEITKKQNGKNIKNIKNIKNKKASFFIKNSFENNVINNSDNINESETKQNEEKKIQNDNQLINEESSQNIEIII